MRVGKKNHLSSIGFKDIPNREQAKQRSFEGQRKLVGSSRLKAASAVNLTSKWLETRQLVGNYTSIHAVWRRCRCMLLGRRTTR